LTNLKENSKEITKITFRDCDNCDGDEGEEDSEGDDGECGVMMLDE